MAKGRTHTHTDAHAMSSGVNHDRVGDLVPVIPCKPGKKCEFDLVNFIEDTVLHAKRGACGGETAIHHFGTTTATCRAAEEELRAPALTHPLQIRMAKDRELLLGILKIPKSGKCKLFVRLTRALSDNWFESAPARLNVPSPTFTRPLTNKQSKQILCHSKPYCLKGGEVHHSQALSMLCFMAKQKWLVLSNKDDDRECSSNLEYSLDLVILPPGDANFEQCLCLLGHRATFLTYEEHLEMPSDEEDDSQPIGTLLINHNIWGETYSDRFAKGIRTKFATVENSWSDHASSNVLTHLVPAINAQKSAHLPTWLSSENLETLFPENRKNSASIVIKNPGVSVSHIKKKAIGSSSAYELAPSDESDEECDASSKLESQIEKRPQQKQKYTLSKKKQFVKQKDAEERNHKAARGSKRPRGSKDAHDDDDDDDDDNASHDGGGTRANESSCEEDSNADYTSDEETSSSDHEEFDESSGSENGDKVVPIPNLKQDNRALAAQDDPSEVTNVMVDISKPCCNHMVRWISEMKQLSTIDAPRMDRIERDVLLMQKPTTSAVGWMAAALSLVTNLADAHADRFKGETWLVNAADSDRLRGIAMNSVKFSNATMQHVEEAINDMRALISNLENVQKQGSDILVAISSAAPPTKN